MNARAAGVPGRAPRHGELADLWPLVSPPEPPAVETACTARARCAPAATVVAGLGS